MEHHTIVDAIAEEGVGFAGVTIAVPAQVKSKRYIVPAVQSQTE